MKIDGISYKACPPCTIQVKAIAESRSLDRSASQTSSLSTGSEDVLKKILSEISGLKKSFDERYASFNERFDDLDSKLQVIPILDLKRPDISENVELMNVF